MAPLGYVVLVVTLGLFQLAIVTASSEERSKLRILVEFEPSYDPVLAGVPHASYETYSAAKTRQEYAQSASSSSKAPLTNGWVKIESDQLLAKAASVASDETITWPDWSLVNRYTYLASSQLYIFEAATQTDANALFVNLQQLQAQGVVKSAEMDVFQARKKSLVNDLNDAYHASLWHLDQVDTEGAWGTTKGNPAIVVAVIDTGLETLHPDLKDSLWVNPGEIAGNGKDDDNNGYIDDVHGYNFVGSEGPIVQDNEVQGFGHGTFCAGVIAAQANNNIGVAGIAPKVKIMGVAAGDDQGLAYSDIVQALNYATMEGAHITSNSYGVYVTNSALEKAFRASQDIGVLAVVAAGNEHNNNDYYPSFPASWPESIIVAVGANSKSDTIASYSNFGATQVDLFAPGGDSGSGTLIVSTARIAKGSYYEAAGTSFATPMVAGAAALILSYWKDLGRFLPGQGPLVKKILLSSVDVLQPYQGVCVSGGRLNVNRALQAAKISSCSVKPLTAQPPYPPLPPDSFTRSPPSPPRPPPLASKPPAPPSPPPSGSSSHPPNPPEKAEPTCSTFASNGIRGVQLLTPLALTFGTMDSGYAALPAQGGFSFKFNGQSWTGDQIFLGSNGVLTFGAGVAGAFLGTAAIGAPGLILGNDDPIMYKAYAGYEVLNGDTNALRVRYEGRAKIDPSEDYKNYLPYYSTVVMEITLYPVTNRIEVAIQVSAFNDGSSINWSITDGTYYIKLLPHCQPCSIRLCSDATGSAWAPSLDRYPVASLTPPPAPPSPPALPPCPPFPPNPPPAQPPSLKALLALSTPAIIGIAVGGGVAALLLLCFLLTACLRSSRGVVPQPVVYPGGYAPGYYGQQPMPVAQPQYVYK